MAVANEDALNPASAEAEILAETRRLSRALAAAADDRIRLAVATVDAMPIRGAADALIALLRPRLTRLRPLRPLNFTRLLFLPLDPLILSPTIWRRGMPGIPRSALMCLVREIKADWPGVSEIEDRLRDVTTGDIEGMMRLGETLWPEAAERLLRTLRPEDWPRATELAEQDHTPIVCTAALVLTVGPVLLRLAHVPPAPKALDGELAAVSRTALEMSSSFVKADKASGLPPGPVTLAPLATFVALLMQRSPRADRALAAMEKLGGADKQTLVAIQTALDFVLDGMVTSASTGTLASATEAMRLAAVMLNDLDSLMEVRPAPRKRLQEVRTKLDSTCRARFTVAIMEILGQTQRVEPPMSPADREELAREARAFEACARRIGSARAYDEVRQVCAARLADSTSDPTTAEERERLVRIMTAPEDQPEP